MSAGEAVAGRRFRVSRLGGLRAGRGAAREVAVVAAAIVAGLALRLEYLRLQEVIGTDGVWYAVLGRNLLRGRGFTDPTGAVSTFYPPLYPISVGLVSLVVGDLERAGRLAALLAGLATLPIVYLIGRLAYGRRVGALATLIAALLPALAENSVLVLSEALFTFCLCGATLAGLLGFRAAGARRLVACGLAGGLLAAAGLTRPEGYQYAPAWGLLILAAAWPMLRARDWRAALGPLVAFGLAYLLVLAPYVLFLRAQTGRWQLSGKVATNVVVAYRGFEAQEANYFGLTPDGDRIGGFAADTDSLLAAIRRAPLGFVKHYRAELVREFDLLFDTLTPILFALLPLGLLVPWPRERRLARAANLLALLPLLTLPVFFLDQRFLLPLMPALAVVAAAGAVALGERLAAGRAERVGRPVVWGTLAAVLALWVAWNAPLILLGPLGNYDRWNQAIESRRAGEWLRASYPPGQVVISRKPYVSFYGDARLVELPLADYDRTIAYARRQGARFLVVDERSLRLYRPQLLPLLDGPPPADLALVYDWRERPGYRIRIFEIAAR